MNTSPAMIDNKTNANGNEIVIGFFIVWRNGLVLWDYAGSVKPVMSAFFTLGA
jgi:hypothetical protein